MKYCHLCRRGILFWQRRRARVHVSAWGDPLTEYSHLHCEIERLLDVLDAPEDERPEHPET